MTVAERLQDVGISALASHGRTRSQMYKGEADWEPIARVKQNPRIKIPIIGNGDIDSPQKVKEAFERYGVDGVMIGACHDRETLDFRANQALFVHRRDITGIVGSGGDRDHQGTDFVVHGMVG